MNAVELLRHKLQNQRRELLVFQGDIENTEKAHKLKFDSLKKDIEKTLKDLDEALL
jgi:hypothetical protein